MKLLFLIDYYFSVLFKAFLKIIRNMVSMRTKYYAAFTLIYILIVNILIYILICRMNI